MKILFRSLILLSLGMLGACSTLKVQKDEVAKVQKVAVVGFSVIQDNPPTPTLSFGKTDHQPSGFNGASCENAEHAQLVLESLNSKLKDNMKWSMLTPDQVNKNDMIQERLKWQKSNGRALELIPNNTECFVSALIPEKFALDRLDFAQRKLLIKTLGVDGIVVVSVRVEYINTGILKAFGSWKPQSTLYFRLYTANQEEPIWMDTWARGEPTAEGTQQFLGFTDHNELNAKVVSSAQTAFADLMKKYSE